MSAPAQGYYLIATASPTINGVIPNALFSAPASPFSSVANGGVAVQNVFGVVLDSVGWTSGGAGPSNAVETQGVAVLGGNFGTGGILTRNAVAAGLSLGTGNSIDTNNNSADVMFYASVAAGYPRNSVSAVAPVKYGIPANGAGIAASDGYSASATASSTGYYLLSAVSTGTWSLNGFWTTYSSHTSENNSVNTGATTHTDLLLEANFVNLGGVSGQILRADTLTPLSGITVKAGNVSTLSDSLGNYLVSVASGTWPVIANETFTNVGYNSIKTTVTVATGNLSTDVNFNLVPSGELTGQITTNGSSPYPNVPVHALSQDLEVATDITDNSGNYELYGVPVGAAAIAPIIDPQSQASNPTSLNVTVTQATLAGNNFTVTSGAGLISGTVTANNVPILTGALVVASTGAMPSPMLVNNAFCTGSTVLFETISDSAGNYSLGVSKGATYTVYGYYTSSNGSLANTASQTVPNVFVTSSSVANLKW